MNTAHPNYGRTLWIVSECCSEHSWACLFDAHMHAFLLGIYPGVGGKDAYHSRFVQHCSRDPIEVKAIRIGKRGGYHYDVIKCHAISYDIMNIHR